jgi:hypothetical protein
MHHEMEPTKSEESKTVTMVVPYVLRNCNEEAMIESVNDIFKKTV